MASDQRRPRILLVDDQPANLRVLGEALRANYDVRVTTSGAKALELAAGEDGPDLILLDVVMPEMDGYEVIRRLKANPVTQLLPVIFVTSLDDENDEYKGLTLGAVDYLPKPVHLPIALARIRTHVELKRKTDQLEQLALRDGLTGVPNRRSLDERLEVEWRRTARGQKMLSFVLADVDFFKRFNDHYGHAAGDDCLRRVAAALSGCVRRGMDMVARYGGEEFAALLPETDSAGALTVAKKMRSAVEALGIEHEFSDAAKVVTISLGTVTLIPSPDQPYTDIYPLADARLYDAKRGGRNRVVGDAGLDPKE